MYSIWFKIELGDVTPVAARHPGLAQAPLAPLADTTNIPLQASANL
jgi:hypothetical protein